MKQPDTLDRDHYKNVLRQRIDLEAKSIADEVHRAKSIHRGMNSLHEGYAVILEELDEVWGEIKQKKPDRSKVALELRQTAAMCLRTIIDLGLDND